MAEDKKCLRISFRNGTQPFVLSVPEGFELERPHEGGWIAVPGGFVSADEVLAVQVVTEQTTLKAVATA